MIAQGIFVNQITEFYYYFLGQHVAHHSSGSEPGDSGHSHGTHHLPADDRHRRLQPHCGGDPGKEEEVRDDDCLPHLCVQLCAASCTRVQGCARSPVEPC